MVTPAEKPRGTTAVFRNADELADAVEDEWERLALENGFAHNLVTSIPRRLQAIIDKRKGCPHESARVPTRSKGSGHERARTHTYA